MLSSPNDGLLELVGHDELEGSLHPHLGVGQLQIHGWQPGLSPSLLPGGLQLLGQGIRWLELDTKWCQRYNYRN